MKRNLRFAALALALVWVNPGLAIGQKQKKKAIAATARKGAASVKVTAAELEEGKGLLTKSDCLGCHKMDIKLVGPAYVDVARKYAPSESNYNYLAKKIITGGSGAWGPVSMSAHPNMSAADANKIAKYILSIKG